MTPDVSRFTPHSGFDVLLGNPPWERVKLQEKEWFAARRPEIADAPNAAARRKLIASLAEEDPPLYAAFQEDLRQAEGESQFLRDSLRFPLCGRGDVNTYAVFAELALNLISPQGRAGIIVPTGIATDDTTKYYFQALMERSALVSLYDFENREKLFPAVDSRMKFCLLTLRNQTAQPDASRLTPGASFVFFAHQVEHLREPERRFTLSAEEIALLNPNTRTCPIFRSQRDAEITKAIYRRVPVLVCDEAPLAQVAGRGAGGEGEANPWGITFLRMFDMSNDSHLFRTREQLEAEGWQLGQGVRAGMQTMDRMGDLHPEYPVHPCSSIFSRGDEAYLPLYEAKLMHQFDHRWATYDGPDTRDLTAAEKADPARLPLPRYWVPEAEVAARLGDWDKGWLLGYRWITNTTNERTLVSGLVPSHGFGNSLPLILTNSAPAGTLGCLTCNLSSFAADYAIRQKLGGTNLTFGTMNQLPILPPATYAALCSWQSETTLAAWIAPRALELTYTAWDLAPFARDCGYAGPPFRWGEERRFLLRCELDAAFFHLYGIAREDVEYILGTFPIVERKDVAAYGEYRTRRVILEVYDAMRRAQETGQPPNDPIGGQPYRTLLDPPPADPRVAHGWETKPEWAR